MRNFLSEFLGTFFLVFFGTGAIIVNGLHDNILGHAGISFVFGMLVMSLIYGLGDISGAHLNPAVSFSFYLSGRFPGKSLLPYFSAQFLGAITASLSLKWLFPDTSNWGETVPANSAGQALAFEFLMSFFLMLIILGVSHGSKESGQLAGIAIGSVVALEALVGGPVSGASMNPARSFGPALISGNIQVVWIYFLGPGLGMMSAVPVFSLLKKKS